MDRSGIHDDDKISKAELPAPFSDRNYAQIPPSVYGFPYNTSSGSYEGTQPYYWDLGAFDPDSYARFVQWEEMGAFGQNSRNQNPWMGDYGNRSGVWNGSAQEAYEYQSSLNELLDRYRPQTQVAIQENGMRLIRFLNGVDSNDAYNFKVDGTDAASGLAYGSFTEYISIPEGIHEISAAVAQSPPALPAIALNIPFDEEEKSTLILVRTNGGLEILKASDDGCSHLSNSTGCVKAANISSGPGAYDIISKDGQTIFGDLRFMDITPFKQAEAGGYDLYVVEAAPNKAAVPKAVLEREEEYPQNQGEEIEQENYFTKFHIHVDSYGIYSIYILGTGDAVRVIVL